MRYTSNEITPQDQYQVRMFESIEISQISYLIHLYQPIIGPEAVSLYLTLRNHLPLQYIGVSSQHLHRHLANQLFVPFHVLMKARKTLEAVGLLRTKKYQHQVEEKQFIEYILVPPLDPVNFFQSDILSILLLNRIGKNAYLELMEQLLTYEKTTIPSEYIESEITKSFDEVFDSILFSEITVKPGSEVDQLIKPYSLTPEKESTRKPIVIKDQYLDIEFIKGMMSNLFQVEQIFSKENIQLFHELAFLYQLSEMDIIHLLHDPYIYDSSGMIQEELLRERVKDRLQFEQKEMLIIEKEGISSSQREGQPINHGDIEKRHKWILEHYSPIELLKQYQGGAKIPEADLALVEGLVRDYQLPFQVVNVLIEYILLSNQYKLPKKLTEKIAGHWKRLKITTVEEALQIAKKEHQLYRGWKEGNKKATNGTTRTNRGRNTEKREKVPDYILNQEKNYHRESSAKSSKEIDPKTQEEIEELLRKLGETEEEVKK
ncbi:replication initiation and membrane attachment family protein [Tepidibacillus fermentans]|uniref:Replicative DNA helicase loader DnaB n=1 Tax=Tepidibacillus fermentans TaxID=1281767 RepID=A0A4R3KIW1_9BACI|nr:DnaD domain protein [Tepidibacillus fermentans]TCS83553.1 replicative DNA helicase loader DnaB [Tepidibacillus fermentans]